MKIVLAIDGSTYSRWAIDLLPRLPLVDRPQTHIVHAVDVPEVPSSLVLADMAEAYRAAIKRSVAERTREGQRLVKAAADRLRSHCREVRCTVAAGPPAHVILDEARKRKADLVVVGARGMSRIDRLLLGSVSLKVVTQAPCSVLVVKRAGRRIRRIVFAADGSRAATRAAKFLTTEFRPEHLRVDALNVWEYPVYPHPRSALVAMLDERYGGPFRKAGMKCETQWVMGHPADQVVRAAARTRSDLVVVGSRGLGTIRRVLLGGVSHQIVKHSDRSVLVVR